MLIALFWIGLFMEMLLTGRVIFGRLLAKYPFCANVSREYPRARRCILYLAVSCLVTICLWTPAVLRDNLSNLNSERDFRLAQSFLLLAILALMFQRGFAMGRNTKGMLLGCGIYIAASLVILAVRSAAEPIVQHAWQIGQPTSYTSHFVCMLICLYAMWAYHPGPQVAASAGGNHDTKAARP